MNKNSSKFAFLAIMAMFVFGFSQMAVAQGNNNGNNGNGFEFYQDLTQLVTNPCTGEPVLLDGRLHIVGFVLTNGQGQHLNLHVQAKKVTATGINTGKVWKVHSNRSEHETFQFNCGQGPITYNNTFSLRSTGAPNGDDYSLHQNYSISFPCGQAPFLTHNNVSVSCH